MTEHKTNMLTIKEASQLVKGLSEYRIRRMCIDGKLPHIKAGKKYLINEDVLMEVVRGEVNK
ncbi:MAG: helix-turn-helix domain-containing protein [Oscillospiraceae bacterium]|nr:helix-turn-helix domain-containing protein [Oscillospiraceae bacterium]